MTKMRKPTTKIDWCKHDVKINGVWVRQICNFAMTIRMRFRDQESFTHETSHCTNCGRARKGEDTSHLPLRKKPTP